MLSLYEGLTPIGVCVNEDYRKDYGDIYYPAVMENDKGERVWVHIPYSRWKDEPDGKIPDIGELVVPGSLN